MYPESTTENFNKIKQTIQEREKEMLKLYSYLSHNKILSQDEHENEAIRIMERIKYLLSNVKLNEISPQENIQDGLRFVNLINEIYVLDQQEIKILQEEDQSIQQLQQAEEELQQAKEQLQQAKEQLQQEEKKLEPIQEKRKLINQQKILYNVFKTNKKIVMQKLKIKYLIIII